MSKVYLKLKDVEKSLQILYQTLEIIEQSNTELNQQKGFIFLEIANINKKKGELTSAIDY